MCFFFVFFWGGGVLEADTTLVLYSQSNMRIINWWPSLVIKLKVDV